MRQTVREICNGSDEAERALRTAAAGTYAPYLTQPLAVPSPQIIRAGIAGGLPFDSLTTDLFLGCLPAREVCYGNCFAARAAFAAGFDFGTRVENTLDEDVFRADLARVPKTQMFLRNGWNSDPSWGWRKAQRLAELIHESGRHTVFITKMFAAIPADVIARFVELGVELRISMSAFDTKPQLELRMRVADEYRRAGGVAVPLVMSASYADDALNAKQDALVRYMVDNDWPCAENSLRFDTASPVRLQIREEDCGKVESSGDLWSGRLYVDVLRIPTLTSLPPGYHGLESPYLSGNSAELLASLWHEPVHTHAEVMSGARLEKPRQCGVALQWKQIGDPPA
jgi:hypothetical protein